MNREVLYEMLENLVGTVPAGLEPVVYIIACIVCVWILSTFFTILWSFLMLLTGGRRV